MAFTVPRTWTDGELVTKAIMDPHVRDNFLAMGPHLIVRKPSDESVTSSTVLQNDDHLLLVVAANEVWRFELQLFWAAATAGDLQWSFTVPAGATFNATTVYPVAAGGSTATLQQMITSGGSSSLETQNTANNLTMFYGLIANGGTAGNLQFQFAQQVSSGTATTVKTHSTLWAVKLA